MYHETSDLSVTLSPSDHVQDLCLGSGTGTLVDQLAEENEDIKVAKVNVDEEPELAGQFRVYSIPMLAAIKDGQMVNQMVGARPKHQILSMF